jgi:hypothetical protein
MCRMAPRPEWRVLYVQHDGDKPRETAGEWRKCWGYWAAKRITVRSWISSHVARAVEAVASLEALGKTIERTFKGKAGRGKSKGQERSLTLQFGAESVKSG